LSGTSEISEFQEFCSIFKNFLESQKCFQESILNINPSLISLSKKVLSAPNEIIIGYVISFSQSRQIYDIILHEALSSALFENKSTQTLRDFLSNIGQHKLASLACYLAQNVFRSGNVVSS
jgi:hypothetical protein